MPATRKKPANVTPTANGPIPPPATDVLTLAEAAAYLRLTEGDVTVLVHSQGLPGRMAGREWRFLKSAIQAWLSIPPPRSSKEALLAMAGKFQDDPDLDEIVREAHRRRGRPETRASS